MMNYQDVKFSKINSRAQMKIQQMAFVLVATVIFFVIVAIFYISIRFSSLREDVTDTRREEVIETVRKISGTPEFKYNSFEDCAACVDMDKLILLRNRTSYENFWQDVSLLQVERVYPRYETEECEIDSYPRCNQITLVKKKNFESYEAYVSLCRYDKTTDQSRCELGKVIMGFEGADDV
jgi:hypothetical protein